MPITEPKIRAGRLESGDEILVFTSPKGLHVATIKKNSFVAVVLGIEAVDAPTPGHRRGYKVRTDRGTIDFVTGVTALMRATDADWKRTRKSERERGREPVPVPESIRGVRLAADQSSPVVTRNPSGKAPTAPPAGTGVTPAVNGVAWAPGPNAVSNYRAMARAATTPQARAWWAAKADAAVDQGG